MRYISLMIILSAVPISSLSAEILEKRTVEVMSKSRSAKILKENILRIEGEASRHAPPWSGVRSCSQTARAQQSAETGVRAWIVIKLKEHPGYTEIRHDWGPARWHFRNKRRHNGARHCTGGVDHLPVWVEMTK